MNEEKKTERLCCPKCGSTKIRKSIIRNHVDCLNCGRIGIPMDEMMTVEQYEKDSFLPRPKD